MTNKQRIVELFENNKGKYISGEEIANRLQITRTSVWKTVKSLKQEGYPIDAVTNKGYCLSEQSDILSKSGVLKYLKNKNINLEVCKTVDSTNNVLKKMAANGADEGTVVISAQQTAGKGRLGRKFYSPDDSGIYLSILLRPQLSAEKSTFITTAAAVAVCKTVEKLSDKNPMIKWVNDVFIDGKKVCGILTEASFGMESGKIDYAVMGTGLNIYTPQNGFPEEIKEIAGCIFDNEENDIRNKFAAEIINQFMELYKNIEKKSFLEEYKKRCFCIEKEVTVVSGDERKKAYVLDIDNNFHLEVRFENGEKKSLSSGEISIRL